MAHFAASELFALGLLCLHMFPKWAFGLKRVKGSCGLYKFHFTGFVGMNMKGKWSADLILPGGWFPINREVVRMIFLLLYTYTYIVRMYIYTDIVRTKIESDILYPISYLCHISDRYIL